MRTREDARTLRTFVVSLTPFDTTGRVDEPDLRGHLRRMADAGIGVYIGGAGSGEGASLSSDETRRLYTIASEELKGKVPVFAMGIEPRTAGEMIQLARFAEEADLDGMQVYSVAAPAATHREVEAYFIDVLDAVRIPVVISIHHLAGYTIPIALVRTLVDRYEQIIGVNCTHADIHLLDAIGAQVAVYVANVPDIVPNLALGGHGFLTSEANLVPRLCVSIIKHWQSGDLDAAFGAWATLLRLHSDNSAFVGIRGLKAALNSLGLPGGYPRRPRLPVAGDDEALVDAMLDRLNFSATEATLPAGAPHS